jgi:hypothetical protein
MSTEARSFINSFTSDLENIQDKYKLHFINPYFRAYEQAMTKFNAAVEAQKKADQAMLELVFSAFSLAGGQIVTKVFAGATLKSVAKNFTLNVICNNNLERAFKVAAFVEGNPTASFIVGKLWDTGQSKLTAKAQEMLKGTVANFPSFKKALANPSVVKSHLEDFIGEAKIKAHDAAADIRENPRLSESEKIAAVKVLAASPFCTPSTKSLDEAQLAIDIELTFWMTTILGLDRVATLVVGHQNWPTTKSIDVLPSSKDYPDHLTPTWQKSKVSTCQQRKTPLGRVITSGCSRERIYYSRMGSKIRDAIDAAYKKKKGKAFFIEDDLNKATLLRAETLLRELAASDINRLAMQAKVGPTN